MMTLFSREFKAVFRNIKSVIALGILTLFSGIFFARNNLLTGYSKIEVVLLYLTLVAAVVVPMVAIFSVSKERKEGADTFVAILPFTRSDIILGKFFGVFGACLVSLSTVALYPLIVALLGAKNVLGSYASVLVLYAMVAFLCALGLLAAYVFKKTWAALLAAYIPLTVLLLLGTFSTAFESSALVALIFFVLLSLTVGACFGIFTKKFAVGAGLSAVGIAVVTVMYFAFRDSLVNSISYFFDLVSPFRRFDLLVFGIFDLSSLVFYLSLCVLLLWMLALDMKPKKMRAKGQKRSPVRTKTAVAAATVLLLCFSVNFVACALPSALTYVDVSDNRLYGLSSNAKKFIKTLDEEVTVYMIDGYKGGEDEVSIERVAKYVERYCSSSSKITLKKIDPENDPEFLKKYGLEGKSLSYCSLVIESAKRWKTVNADQLFAYYHEQVGYMTLSQLESLLTQYTKMYETYVTYAQTYAPNDQSILSEIENLKNYIISLSEDSVLCFCAEQSITESIEYVCAEYVPTVYSLTGKGEKSSLGDSLDIRGLSRIPDDVGLLIVNAPTEDYANEEISALLDFAERGGRIIFLTNKSNASMPNLARLLACYGISLEDEVIFSGKVQTTLGENQGEGIALVGASGIKTAEVEGVKTEPLLTVTLNETEGETQTNVTKNVAVVSYKGEIPAITLITGADTFNSTDKSLLSEEEGNNVVSFLLNIASTVKKNFASSVSFDAPKVYAIGVQTEVKSGATFFVVLFAVIAPIAVVGAPLFSAYIRSKRSKSGN